MLLKKNYQDKNQLFVQWFKNIYKHILIELHRKNYQYMTFNSSWGSSWPWSYGSWIYNYLMQSVPITTDFVSSNIDQGEVYNIML